MKSIFRCLLAVLFPALLSGCSILEKEPLDIYSDATLWNDPALIDGYLRECYAEMKFFNEISSTGDYGTYENVKVITMPTNMSDEACFWGLYNWRHFSYYNDAWPWWNYPLVRKLNIFLEKLENSPIAEEDKLMREGEARFLRAFTYFNMVKRYGGVPLLTSPVWENSPEELLYPVRAKEDEIYQFILDEIDWITSNVALPKEQSAANYGRATYWAALALKSRAALYAGTIAKYTVEEGFSAQLILESGAVGIPVERAEYYLEASFEASDEIISDGPFDLFKRYLDGTREGYVKNYQYIFIEKDHPEVIFAEKFTGSAGKGHSWDLYMAPFGYTGWGSGQQARVFPQTVDAYEYMDGSSKTLLEWAADNRFYTIGELFGNKDPRYSASVYTEGDPYSYGDIEETTLHYYAELFTSDGIVKEGAYKGFEAVGFCTRKAKSAMVLENYFGVKKYLQVNEPTAASKQLASSTDWIVFRLAEIYLNRAEAGFILGKGTPKADVDLIRHRAGMPAAASLDVETIRHERQVELMFEGARFFDIKRWRAAARYLSKNPYSIRYQLDYASTQGADGKLKNPSEWRFKVVDNGPTYSDSGDNVFRYQDYYSPLTRAKYTVNHNLEENPGWLEEEAGAAQ